ncbi:hypothetical protein FACS18948_0590 [Clostridia bacterium]|nr:hypothetical protein FACS18948_0590 [Clostridia bacterium]
MLDRIDTGNEYERPRNRLLELIDYVFEAVPALLAKVTRDKALAAIFVVMIFFIGTATFPQTLVTIGDAMKAATKDVIKTRDTINTSYTGMLTTAMSNNVMVNKAAYLNVNGFMARLMGQRLMNQRVLLDNGHIVDLRGKSSQKSLDAQILSITSLYQAQRDKGKYYLCVIPPGKISKYGDTGLPAGFNDYYNDNNDRLIEALRKEGVPVLDLRDLVEDEGLVYADLHYKTDHHWKAETGFWAYGKIMEHLTSAGVVEPIDPKYTSMDSQYIYIYIYISNSSSVPMVNALVPRTPA